MRSIWLYVGALCALSAWASPSIAEVVFHDAFVERAPVLVLDQRSIEFDNVLIGKRSIYRELVISNAGVEPLILRGIEADNPFEVQSDDCSTVLAPQESCTAKVFFAPNVIGDSQGSLVVYSNDPRGSSWVDVSGQGGSRADVFRLDLQGASGVVQEALTNSAQESDRSSDTESRLWKSTDEGLDLLDILDGADAPTDVDIINIWTLEGNAAIAHVRSGSADIGLFVEKNSGVAYNVTDFINIEAWSSFEQWGSDHFDFDLMRWYVRPRMLSGSLYFFTLPGPSDLARLNFGSDLDNPTYEVLPSNQIDDISTFEVSDDNEILVYRGTNESGATVDRALRVSDGSLVNLATVVDTSDPPTMFRGLDGNVYALSQIYTPDPNESYCELAKVYFDSDDQLVAEKMGPMMVETSDGQASQTSICEPFTTREITIVAGKLLFSLSGDQYDIEVDVAARQLKYHVNKFEFDPLKELASQSYIWGFGVDSSGVSKIGRYDPASRQTIELEFPLDWEVIDFQPLGNDSVTFKARRLSDLALIVGEATLDGTETTYEVYNEISSDVLAIRPLSISDFIVVDGDGSDWSASLRVLDSLPESGPEGHDLRGYSESVFDDRYYGLIDFNDEIDVSGVNHVSIPPYLLVVSSEGIEIQGEQNTSPADSVAAGVRLSIGKVYEFSIPLNLLPESTLNAEKVSRFHFDSETDTLTLVDQTLE